MQEPSLLLYSDDKVAIGAYEHVHIVLYRRHLEIETLRRDREAQEAMARRFPRGFGLVYMSQPNLALPSPEIRRESASMLAANKKRVVAAAIIVSGDGFWASAARSVVTGINVVAAPPYPIKTFDDDMSAASWLSPQIVGLSGGAMGLARAIRDVREST